MMGFPWSRYYYSDEFQRTHRLNRGKSFEARTGAEWENRKKRSKRVACAALNDQGFHSFQDGRFQVRLYVGFVIFLIDDQTYGGGLDRNV